MLFAAKVRSEYRGMAMDHRWNDSTVQDRATRAEGKRFAASGIERDLDVERRDLLDEEEERKRRESINQTPWSIGGAFYDQRDLYTRNASIEEDGYGHGPSYHPEEGSYAYPREFHPGFFEIHEGDANLFEREAWPWLNYKSPHEDPYFVHLHAHEAPTMIDHVAVLPRAAAARRWRRLKQSAVAFGGRLVRALRLGRRPSGPSPANGPPRRDSEIQYDAERALRRRDDLDASDIEVEVQSGTVTLEGTVTDRRSKRLAKNVCEGVLGVRAVRNRLKIRHDEPTSPTFVFARPLAPFA